LNVLQLVQDTLMNFLKVGPP